MPPERLIYEQSFEGLFVRGLSGRLSFVVKEQLRAAGVDLDQKLQATYPVEVWERCVAIVAQALYPGQPETVVYPLLGARMVDGFKDSRMGRAMLGVLRLLGPRRMLGRARQILRAGNNYLEVRLTEHGPREVELWVNETGPTRYLLQGSLTAMLRIFLAAQEEARVEVSRFDAEGVTFQISWGPRAPSR